jgi:predicted patatin/cPLA2 family phospholipase
LEALIERIIGRLTETELQRLIDSQKLRIMATSAHQAKAVAFNAPINREQLVNYLIASCSLPFLAKPKDIDGEHFFDALLSEPIPHQTIIANGFTHILVLSTRPYGYSGGKQRLNALFINRVTAHYGKPLRSLASARRQAAPEFARTLHAQSLKPESSPYILTIAPSGTKDPVGNLSRNIPSIERAGLLGANAMRHQLGLASISDFTLLER